MEYTPVLSAQEVTDYVRSVFPQADDYGWSISSLSQGQLVVDMAIDDRHLRPGGTVSGPTMFALADVGAYLLVLSHVGKVALAVTTSLNINFLSKPAPGDLYARTRFIKLGKRLAVCEVHIHGAADDNLVAQATVTYSIPPR